MTIREFAKLNNFPIKGKLTRIPDEVEYDFNDQPHNCKRYVDEDFNEYGIHEDGFIVAIPCEKAWGFSADPVLLSDFDCTELLLTNPLPYGNDLNTVPFCYILAGIQFPHERPPFFV